MDLDKLIKCWAESQQQQQATQLQQQQLLQTLGTKWQQLIRELGAKQQEQQQQCGQQLTALLPSPTGSAARGAMDTAASLMTHQAGA